MKPLSPPMRTVRAFKSSRRVRQKNARNPR
ncbi:hypothetical protein A2U01_0085168, partial [Trifolium medium]|nr:hypothetical protein [Trifolium medium]